MHSLPSYLVTLPVHTRQVRDCMARLVRHFGLKDHEWHEPHITLCGPFTLRPSCDPAARFADLPLMTGQLPCCDARLMDPLILEGRRGWAVVIRADPSTGLAQLAADIRDTFFPVAETLTWIDRIPGRRIFHISLGFGLRHERAQAIRNALDLHGTGTGDLPGICRLSGTVLRSHRLEVFRRGVVWGAFDLAQGAWLNRREALMCRKEANEHEE